MKSKTLITTVFLILLSASRINAQELTYNETSSTLFCEKNSTILDLGINYNLGYKELQSIYNINKKYSVFGKYVFNNTQEVATDIFGGSSTTYENNNDGYTFGAGIRNFGKIGGYETLEALGGYEFHQNNILSYYTYSRDFKSFLEQSYSKYFVQFNLAHIGPRHFSALSLKISYFKFIENRIYKGEHNLFINPTYSYNHNFLKNKALLLTVQIGVAFPIKRFEKTYTFENGQFARSLSNYVIDGVLKFGFQYRINFKKQSNL